MIILNDSEMRMHEANQHLLTQLYCNECGSRRCSWYQLVAQCSLWCWSRACCTKFQIQKYTAFTNAVLRLTFVLPFQVFFGSQRSELLAFALSVLYTVVMTFSKVYNQLIN